MIVNPIIRGFNPDPSVIRIGDDYYIATSTFEWFPEINIYHSRDLVNWTLHSRVLNKKKLLDLTGVPDGGDIWAPSLTYDGKKVYLVYTVVKERGPMMQTDNYLIEADDINGTWSDRVYLNSVGFDPSLFHDDDGKRISFFADGRLVCDNVDASILSDEHIHLGFTGAMVGVNCVDIEKRERSAIFKNFEYKNALI